MSDYPDRNDGDLESLLRRALHEQADRVQPLGDGLAKIQQRAAGRRRRRSWLRPTLAALAAAVAVVGALGVPALLHRSAPDSGTENAASAPSRTQAATTHSSTPMTPETAPSTPARYVPSWPYSSDIAALRSKSSATLRSPEALATSFVYSFVSTVPAGTAAPAKLVAKMPQQQPPGKGVTVDVERADLGRSICQVRLSQLSGSPASYVVTGATTKDLTVRATGTAQGAESVRVGGTYKLASDQSATQLWSALVVPDGSTTPELQAPTADDPMPQWSRQLNLPKRASGPAIVAAWTVDPDGNVLDFTAVGAH
jgi:hypothetical protein